MQHIWLAIILSISLSGCAWQTYRIGAYKELLKKGTPRSEVLKSLGRPVTTEKFKSFPDTFIDVYYSKKVISDYSKASGYAELAGMTWGISELVAAPYSWIDHNIPRSKRLQIFYDLNSKIEFYQILPANKIQP